MGEQLLEMLLAFPSSLGVYVCCTGKMMRLVLCKASTGAAGDQPRMVLIQGWIVQLRHSLTRGQVICFGPRFR